MEDKFVVAKNIRERILARQVVAGTWLGLGSSVTAEVIGRAGFDWVLIDLEHGMGDLGGLVGQLQALESTSAASIVRIPWNDAPFIKRVLDMGAAGVMVPYVNSAEEAQCAVRAMRYPPEGIRGVATVGRLADFGSNFTAYFETANRSHATIVQVETGTAVDNAEAIASVDGVDALFVGPFDLSTNLGIPGQLDHPVFREALQKVSNACRGAGKAAGILIARPEMVAPSVADGFTCVALGTDIGVLSESMRQLVKAFDGVR
ncbi:MAG: HpcH/HpaI aldolase family protein [Armatimonadota bacterium]